MENKTRFITVLILVFLLIVGLYSFIKSGQKGISTFISTLISILIWALIIGLVIFVFYFLFIYEKLINVTFEIYKNIEEEGRISKADNLNYLWLGGDTEHKAKRIGKIIGYSKRKNFKTIGSNKKMKIFQNESCFIIKVGVFKKIIVRCPSKLHDTLQGDVFLKCASLVKHALYFYPDNVHLDFDTIDHTIYYEGERYVQIESISMLAPLVKKSIGIDYKDLIALEGKSGMDMIKDVMKGGAK